MCSLLSTSFYAVNRLCFDELGIDEHTKLEYGGGSNVVIMHFLTKHPVTASLMPSTIAEVTEGLERLKTKITSVIP